MSPLVLGLVLLSAALHILWNTLAKACTDKLSLAWLSTVLGGAFLLPLFLASRLLSPGGLDREVWLWAGFSGVFQTAYVVLLFAAYGAADLSVVYPVNRGLSPLLVLALAGLVVADRVSPAQGAALGVVVAGTVVVGLSSRTPGGRVSARGLALAGLAALSTAGYTLADRKAMCLPQAPSAVEYLFVTYLFLGLLLTVHALRVRGLDRAGWRSLGAEWRRSRRDVLLVSLFTPLSYLCVVAAMGLGNAILISAARNVGVLLSTLAGALLLGERASRSRTAGALLVFAGLAALALAPR
jgi:drug/metabolite transporter (DMT)-like permease